MRALIALLICFGVFVNCQPPGFKATVSQNGLSYLLSVGIEILAQQLEHLQIPDINGQTKTPIGTISYSLTGISLQSFNLGTDAVGILAGQGLSISIQNLACSAHLNWHYRENSWPHISDSGTADIDVSSVSAFCNLAGVDSGFHSQVSVISDGVNVGNLDIHLHGGASWLYSIFVGVFKGQIKDAINKALSSAITANINGGLNKVLMQLPIAIPLGKSGVEIDYGLVANPTFGNGYVSLPDQGEFYIVGNHQECPNCARNPIPDQPSGQMLAMVISDFVANSAGFAFYQLGKLTVRIYDKNLPSWSPIRLNTTDFAELLPSLYKEYPGYEMSILLYCTTNPQATFEPSGITVVAYGNLEVDVVLADGSLTNTFVLNGSVVSSAIALLEQQTVYGNMSYLNGNFDLLSSNIGPVNVTAFISLLDVLFADGVIPVINGYLENGFPLPTVPGLQLQNSNIGYGQDYFFVATDFTYQPPEELYQQNKFDI